ncbi:hypothetical protein HKX48_009428 [Thoreauomyces humboldtii]|nr:hypothetical protein HKX48_009428 [Thoreauomyces humboldtii]
MDGRKGKLGARSRDASDPAKIPNSDNATTTKTKPKTSPTTTRPKKRASRAVGETQVLPLTEEKPSSESLTPIQEAESTKVVTRRDLSFDGYENILLPEADLEGEDGPEKSSDDPDSPKSARKALTEPTLRAQLAEQQRIADAASRDVELVKQELEGLRNLMSQQLGGRENLSSNGDQSGTHSRQRTPDSDNQEIMDEPEVEDLKDDSADPETPQGTPRPSVFVKTVVKEPGTSGYRTTSTRVVPMDDYATERDLKREHLKRTLKSEYAMLPKFSGNGDITVLSRFLDTHEAYLGRTYEEDSIEIQRHLALFLEKNAYAWFTTLQRSKTLDEMPRSKIFATFKDKYLGPTQKNNARAQLEALTFDGTSPEIYHTKFNKLELEARLAGGMDPIPESDLFAMFFSGYTRQGATGTRIADSLIAHKAVWPDATFLVLQAIGDSIGQHMGLQKKKKQPREDGEDAEEPAKKKQRPQNNNV